MMRLLQNNTAIEYEFFFSFSNESFYKVFLQNHRILPPHDTGKGRDGGFFRQFFIFFYFTLNYSMNSFKFNFNFVLDEIERISGLC